MFLCNVGIQPQDCTLSQQRAVTAMKTCGTCFVTDFLQQYLALWFKSQCDTFLANELKILPRKMCYIWKLC